MDRSIRLEPSVSELDRLRAFLAEDLQDLDAERSPLVEVLVAATEVFVNACEHGEIPAGGQVQVHMRRAARDVEIVLEYEGVRFTPTSFDLPDPTTLPEHGMGLHIARQLLDTLEFVPSAAAHGRQRVHLHKRM